MEGRKDAAYSRRVCDMRPKKLKERICPYYLFCATDPHSMCETDEPWPMMPDPVYTLRLDGEVHHQVINCLVSEVRDQ